MVSKNLTEEGQRKKWYDQRKATLAKKSYELAELCQADVALFIRPFGENSMFVFKSRPDFPHSNVSNIKMTTPGDYIESNQLRAARQGMQVLSEVDASNEWANMPKLSQKLCEQSQPETRVELATPLPVEGKPRSTEGTPGPTEVQHQPLALDLDPKTPLQLDIRGPAAGISPTLFVSPPVTPRRTSRRGVSGRRRGRNTIGLLRPRA